jgi:hypothetical protein
MSRSDLVDFAKNLIGSELNHVGIAVFLKANRDIAGQFGLGQQPASVASAPCGLGQPGLVASVQIPGNLG